MHYFSWKLEFFSNIFPVVVNGITSTCVNNNQKQSRFHKFLSIELFQYFFPLIFPKIWHAFMNKNHWKGNTYHETLQLMFYQQGIFRWAKCTWWTIKIYLLVCKLLGLMAEWIPAIRNRVESIFSSKNHSHHCNSCEKSQLQYVYLQCCVPPISMWLKMDSFFSLVLFSPGVYKEEGQRSPGKQFRWFFKNVIYLFAVKTFKTSFGKCLIFPKIWK